MGKMPRRRRNYGWSRRRRTTRAPSASGATQPTAPPPVEGNWANVGNSTLLPPRRTIGSLSSRYDDTYERGDYRSLPTIRGLTNDPLNLNYVNSEYVGGHRAFNYMNEPVEDGAESEPYDRFVEARERIAGGANPLYGYWRTAARLRDVLNHIPNGFKVDISTCRSLTVGQLVTMISPAQIHGLYLSGSFDVIYTTSKNNTAMKRVVARNVPLARYISLFQDNASVYTSTFAEDGVGFLQALRNIPFYNRNSSSSIYDLGQDDAGNNKSDLDTLCVPFARDAEVWVERLLHPVTFPGNGYLRRIVTGGLPEMLSFTNEKTGVFWYDGVSYTVIIPPGDKFCLPFCVEAFLRRAAKDELEIVKRLVLLDGDNTTEEEVEQCISTYVNGEVLYDYMYRFVGAKSPKAFKKMLKEGLSNSTISSFAKAVYESSGGALLPVVYYPRHETRGAGMENRIRICEAGSFSKTVNIRDCASTLCIPVFRIGWTGVFYEAGCTESKYNATQIGGMLHAITVYPPPPQSVFKSICEWTVFKNSVEGVTKVLMDSALFKSAGNLEHVEPFDVIDAISYENNNCVGGTTMYGSEDCVDKSLSMPERRSFNGGGGKSFYVEKNMDRMAVAFDFETVTNDNSVVVDDPLYNNVVLGEDSPYEPRLLGKQVPITVCWAEVKSIVDSEDVREVLSPEAVNFEDGKGVPGICVKDFIDNVVKLAKSRKKKVVYLFSHNGSKFDNMIFIAFNRWFKLTTILLTGRGAISMGYKVDGVRLKFCDTYLLMNASLARVGEQFHFPKEFCKSKFDIQDFTLKDYVEGVEGCGGEKWDLFKKYAIKDVHCLAYLCVVINRMFDLSGENARRLHFCENRERAEGVPIEEQVTRPPIFSYCTNMSFVRKIFGSYMKGLNVPLPKAVGSTFLRRWINASMKGGTVCPSGRVGLVGSFCEILEAFISCGGDCSSPDYLEVVNGFLARCGGEGYLNLDMTSLYPTVMRQCALPTHPVLEYLGADGCKRAIEGVRCASCELQMSVCDMHQTVTRPFAVILVKNFRPGERVKRASPNTFTGRKILYGTQSNTLKHGGSESVGIVHSFESSAEATKRINCKPESGSEDIFGHVQSWTNVELYMAQEDGWLFDIVCGFGWETSFAFQRYVDVIFDLRVKAKEEQNDALQTVFKLMLNGGYGVHAQKDISEKVHICDEVPADLRFSSHKEASFEKYVRTNTRIIADELLEHVPLASGQSILKTTTGDMFGGGSFMNDRSPNHIGSAILSYAKYLMWLVFRGVGYENVVYTDTDSMLISRQAFLDNTRLKEMMDPAGTKLGMFKNDYGEGHVVIGYFIGGKKVKTLITLHEESGKLGVFNTCKGFISDSASSVTAKEKSIADFITHIGLVDGLPPSEGYRGQKWSRSLLTGVEIGDTQVNPGTVAYLGYAKKFLLWKGERGGIDSRAVFHGSKWEKEGSMSFDVFGSRKDDVLRMADAPLWREAINESFGGKDVAELVAEFLACYYHE